MSLMDLVSQHLGNEQVGQIASRLGASDDQTQNAIGMALPTLVAALAKKADEDNGIADIESSLGDHDEQIFSKLGSALAADGDNDVQGIQALGGGMLGNILGGRQGKVETGIGKASGLSGGQVASLLSMLAPMVMGAVGKKKREGNGDLGGMLRGEKETIEKQATGGLLAGLLDQDGDGDFDFSDVMKLGMKKLFGR